MTEEELRCVKTKNVTIVYSTPVSKTFLYLIFILAL